MPTGFGQTQAATKIVEAAGYDNLLDYLASEVNWGMLISPVFPVRETDAPQPIPSQAGRFLTPDQQCVMDALLQVGTASDYISLRWLSQSMDDGWKRKNTDKITSYQATDKLEKKIKESRTEKALAIAHEAGCTGENALRDYAVAHLPFKTTAGDSESLYVLLADCDEKQQTVLTALQYDPQVAPCSDPQLRTLDHAGFKAHGALKEAILAKHPEYALPDASAVSGGGDISPAPEPRELT